MRQINFLTRWKIQLNSTDSKLRVIALTEIVEMLNNLPEEMQFEISKLFINSDICHFLSEIVTYRNVMLMSLTNKLVCYLSENEEFFKRDFFKILKGYLRVIAMFPDFSSDLKHQTDIFTCINIIFKR